MASVQTLSILMTDMVGSTGLASRVGPAAADDLRREHFSLLREALAETAGSEVKNTGDGLMVAFGSPSAAVECAVAMQQSMERRNRRADEQLLIRIGIGVGEVTAEDSDYFGMPVVEAARLCDKAQAGGILTTELVRAICGRHQDFAAVGRLELKGVPEPVEAFEVGWQPVERAPHGMPLPRRLQGVPPIAFVGREAEREQLKQLLEQARAGGLRIVLLSGEPGIGKTRLACHAALEAHAEDATVLFGRSEEDLRVPYGPWAEALSHYVEHAPEAALRAHIARVGGEVARLVPALRRRLPDAPSPRETDLETERYLLFGAVADLLDEASRRAPVVLILDDLHWADKPSHALIKHLAVKGSEAALLVIGTYRDSDLTRGHPLAEILADLRKEEMVERIPLGGLQEQQVVSLMQAAAGHELRGEGLALAREIRRETDGNPFFVAELLRHLGESGAIYQGESGRWVLAGELAELGLPQSLKEVIGARVERLGAGLGRTLRTAAVIGGDFDLDLLSRVTGEGEEELLEQLTRAVGAALLQESAQVAGRFSFAHALVNHTLYDELGPTRRAALHRSVAEALEQLVGDEPGERVEELAQHWARATTPTEANKTIDYCRLAGERALVRLAPDEARRWFEQALEILEQAPGADPARRCDLLTGLGDAQRQAGVEAFRDTLLEAARLAAGLRDGGRLARAALANSRGFTSTIGRVDDERIAVLEQALEQTQDTSTRASLLSLLAMELTHGAELERRLELSGEALRLAREAGDRKTLAWVLARRFFAVLAPETSESLLEETSELTALADEVDDPVLQFWAAAWRACAVSFHADLEEFDRCRAREHELAERVDQPVLRWMTTWTDAARAAFAGSIDEAETLAQSAAQLGVAAGQPDALTIFFGAQLVLIRYEQGRLGEIVDLMRQAAEDNPGIPGLAAGLALAYCELDRAEEARPLLARFARNGFADVPRDVVTLTTLGLFSETAAELGEREAAAKLYERLEPFSGGLAFSGATIRGPVDLYLGRLAATCGRYDDAARHFAAAASLVERIEGPTWLARVRVGWARMLFERGRPGDAEHARELARQALATARELGLGGIERRASGLLEAAAIR
jgi:class 3 adenylate cyclase/tetratricopeptide (TPR) repeat protein